MYYELDNYSQALDDLDKALEIYPKSAFAFESRGTVHRVLGNYKQALADLDMALEINPKSALAFESRGSVYRVLGNYSEAQADLKKALEIDPESSTGLLEHGKLYYELSNCTSGPDSNVIKKNVKHSGYINWISPDELSVIKPLAKGGFGHVCIANWFRYKMVQVVLKSIKGDNSATSQLVLQDEVSI